MSGTILWDVDTQVDFIEPGGKLYFAGAEVARPAMAWLVEPLALGPRQPNPGLDHPGAQRLAGNP